MPAPAAVSPPPPRPDRSQRLEQGRAFAIEAARLCADLRCRDVKVLDVAGLSPLCDFFVLATAISARQLKSVAQDTEELGESRDFSPMRKSRHGEPNERWIAVDLVDVVVHIFSDEARIFYDLDNLWGDAKPVDWNAGREPPSA